MYHFYYLQDIDNVLDEAKAVSIDQSFTVKSFFLIKYKYWINFSFSGSTAAPGITLVEACKQPHKQASTKVISVAAVNRKEQELSKVSLP